MRTPRLRKKISAPPDFSALLTPRQFRTLCNQHRKLSELQMTVFAMLTYSEEGMREICRFHPSEEAQALLGKLQHLHERQKEWLALTDCAIERMSKVISVLKQ